LRSASVLTGSAGHSRDARRHDLRLRVVGGGPSISVRRDAGEIVHDLDQRQ
jgi:hypothetical protein